MAWIGVGVRLDTNLLSSGVYRDGQIAGSKDRDVLFYRDGRTATVTATRTKPAGWLSLATNGKPDASLTSAWFAAIGDCSDSNRAPFIADAGTQSLMPLIPLAYAPQARTGAVIGQGSGMSSHLMLGSPKLQELVTIEIEPQMIAGSRVFYPWNRRSFDDSRSHIVIDDAKSYFASEQRQYDVIISEPSNPWVSGVSGLFTSEFYQRIRGYLTPNGVFGQWLHVYELDDGLVLSVLAALHQNFASYEVYQVSHGDLLIVASNRRACPSRTGPCSSSTSSRRISAASHRSRLKCSTGSTLRVEMSWAHCFSLTAPTRISIRCWTSAPSAGGFGGTSPPVCPACPPNGLTCWPP
jgi:spermidine synthase